MNINRLFLLLITSLPAVGLAASDSHRFHLGTSVGIADVDDTVDFIANDETDTALRIFGGYAVTDRWMVELAYLDAGDYTSPIATVEGGGRVQVDLDGFSIGVKPRFPVAGQWFAQGQLGLFFWDADATLTAPSGRFRDSEHGQDPYYGVGLGREFGSSWQLMGDWIRYETDETDVDFLGVSLTYRMGG